MRDFFTSLPAVQASQKLFQSKGRLKILRSLMGSGKTLGLPYAMSELYNMSSLLTQPLVENTIGTAEYLAQLLDQEVGKFVGYSTGEAKKYIDMYQKRVPERTKLLYCTEALELPRALFRPNWFDILWIDEIDQFTLPGETLLAWALDSCRNGTLPFSWVVFTSGTLPAEELSAHLDGAPIIDVEMPAANIADQAPGSSIVDDIRRLCAQGYDPIVFLPGAGEIHHMMDQLHQIKSFNHAVVPFYGNLSREKKNLIYKDYPEGRVILASPGLWLGKTIRPTSPERQIAIISSGVHREQFYEFGTRGLHLQLDAQSQLEQQRARTGRVNTDISGIFILHPWRGMYGQRPKHPKSDVYKDDPAAIVLKLLMAGYKNVQEMPFFHPLTSESVTYSFRKLYFLGATRSDNSVTPDGWQFGRFPLSPEHASMVHAAQEETPAVKSGVNAVVSVLESGSLKGDGDWKAFVTENETSDLLAELDLFVAAMPWYLAHKDLAELGINEVRFENAWNTYRRLHKRLDLIPGDLSQLDNEERQKILEICLTSFLEYIYVRQERGDTYVSLEMTRSSGREIEEASVVLASKSHYVIGTPFTLGTRERLTFVTPVDIPLLEKIGSRWMKTELRNFYTREGSVWCEKAVAFRGSELYSEQILVPRLEQAAEDILLSLRENVQKAVHALAYGLAENTVSHKDVVFNKAVLVGYEELCIRMENSPVLSFSALVSWFERQLGEIYIVDDVEDLDLRLTDNVITQLLGVDYPAWKTEVRGYYPDLLMWDGVSLAVSYKKEQGKRRATIVIPFDKLRSVTDEHIPGLGMPLDLRTEKPYEHLSASRVEELLVKIEANRLQAIWNKWWLARKDEPVYVAYGEQLPELPNPEVYDEKTSSFAFASYELPQSYQRVEPKEGFTAWIIRWHQTLEDATRYNEQASVFKAKLEAQARKVLLKQTALTELDKVLELYQQIQDYPLEMCGLTSSDLGQYGNFSKRFGVIRDECKKDPEHALQLLSSVRSDINAAAERYVISCQEKLEADALVKKVDLLMKTLREGLERHFVSGDLIDRFSWQDREAWQHVKAYRYTQAKILLEKLIADMEEEAEALESYYAIIQAVWYRDYYYCPYCQNQDDFPKNWQSFKGHLCAKGEEMAKHSYSYFPALESVIRGNERAVLMRLWAWPKYNGSSEFTLKFELGQNYDDHDCGRYQIDDVSEVETLETQI